MENLVSIIVNCYNGEKYLSRAINSVLDQKYKKWELIFWDNQSSDNSKRIFLNFSDQRLKYFYAKRHTTLYEARNLACRKTSGKYIAFLDCDDLWYDNFLSSRLDFFNSNKYDFSYANSYYLFEKSKKKTLFTKKLLKKGLIYNFLAKEYLVTISSLILKKEIFQEISFFNPRYNIIGDFDLVMKIAKTKQAHAVQNPLLEIRIHGQNFLDKNRKMFFREFLNWFLNQENDEYFRNNKIKFFKKLLYLFIISIMPIFIKDFFKKK